MSRKRIRKNIYERCLLTDIAPFETPLIWSNWGSFNYLRSLRKENSPTSLKLIFDKVSPSVPYEYTYHKNASELRKLSVVHPNASSEMTSIYKEFGLMILHLCKKSSYSMRKPHSVAQYFIYGRRSGTVTKYVEELNENKVYASSYFKYLHFSHLHKFYESIGFTSLEEQYQYMSHSDISKCFPSIYTHTIDWAIRGREAAKTRAIEYGQKDHSLGRKLDKFMQNVNYNETNGIVVGPEFSRIFAEIILQEIDQRIEKSMSIKGFQHEKHYSCARYIDDYFIFHNEPGALLTFREVLAQELEHFKLYTNTLKSETTNRPFISNISIKKIRISEYVDDLIRRMEQKGYSGLNSGREINKIRSILKDYPEENYTITNFFLSAITRKLFVLYSLNNEQRIAVLRLLVDLAFYLLRIDIRVSSVFRITKFVLEAIKYSNRIPDSDRSRIHDKIFHHLSDALAAAQESDMVIESMNLLIAASQFWDEYRLNPRELDNITNFCRKVVNDGYHENKRLTYFEIVTILYYIQSNPEYGDVRDKVLVDIKLILSNLSPLKYSESAHLLVDIISCPFIERNIKFNLAKISLSHLPNDYEDSEINRFINFTSRYSWYTNWGSAGDLDRLLRKKELILPY